MSTLPGDPALLMARVSAQVATAAHIEAAAGALRSLAVDGESVAIDAVRQLAAVSAHRLDAVHERLRESAGALETYTAALRAVHARLAAASDERAAAQVRLALAVDEVDLGRARLELLRATSTMPHAMIEDAESAVLRAQWQVERLTERIDAAEAEQREAVDDLNAAAERAIAALELSMDSMGVDDDRLGAAARGVDAVLADAWTAFVDRLGAVVGGVVIAVESGGRALAELAGGILMLTQLGPLLDIPAPLIGLLASPAGALLLASAVLVAAQLLLALTVRAVADGRRPDPEVRPLRMDEANERERDALVDLRGLPAIDGLDDLARVGGYVDRLGGDREGAADAKTVVDIARIGDDPPHWVVTLPSTQDWQAAGVLLGEWNGFDDAGAVNDMDANVAMLVVPQVRTQIERGVLEAMRLAGIGSGEPVMLVGFSQGGILAAHLASSASIEFNVTRVLAVGAPIDGIAIPAASAAGAPVRVLSIQHAGDPIVELDLRDPPEERGHWRTIEVGAVDSAGVPVHGPSVHDIDLYRLTLARLVEGDAALDDAFRDFMGGVASRRQYEFSE